MKTKIEIETEQITVALSKFKNINSDLQTCVRYMKSECDGARTQLNTDSFQNIIQIVNSIERDLNEISLGLDQANKYANDIISCINSYMSTKY